MAWGRIWVKKRLDLNDLRIQRHIWVVKGLIEWFEGALAHLSWKFFHLISKGCDLNELRFKTYTWEQKYIIWVDWGARTHLRARGIIWIQEDLTWLDEVCKGTFKIKRAHLRSKNPTWVDWGYKMPIWKQEDMIWMNWGGKKNLSPRRAYLVQEELIEACWII